MMTVRSRLLASTLLFGMAAIATPAIAQVGTPANATGTSATGDQQVTTPDDESATEVVVTGSRIARRDLESAAPVAVVKAEEFALSGAVNVESVLNSLPQAVPATTSASNNPGGGVATLDLRGLGANRSLVLVNGRRYMFYDVNQLTDLNTIPAFLLDGVDVVTGGASAVYGSDAIAGVVNFRLRNNLEGIEAGGQYNITEDGDGARYQAYLAVGGKLGERGHATVYGEYYNRKSVFAGARPFSSETLGDDGAGGLVAAGSPTTNFGRLTSTYAAANCPAGNIYCGGGAIYTQAGIARPRVATDLYNFGAVNYLQVPQERYLLGAYADYEIADGHTVYMEASFVNNRVANELAATPVTGVRQVSIAAVSPFISAANIAALNQLDSVATTGNTVGDGIVPLSVTRRTTETGGRNTLDERNAFRILTGVRGNLTEAFNYDLSYMYARTRNANVQRGNISNSAFNAGLNGTAPAINIFGPNTLTPAMVNQISILAQNGDVSTLEVLNANVSGSLFNLGTGADDVGIAIGGEYRRMASEFIPDTALSSGDVIGFNAGQATAGAYNVKEVFGELRVPIAARTPGFYELELTGAARYSDYSLGAVGGVWTYAGGIKYAPVKGVAFRGQYQRAVRAPNVAELFGGLAVGFPAASDPCATPAAASAGALRDLCIATGVPAAAVGTEGVQEAEQIQGQFGGNPNLQEEVSDSYTAGVVLTPLPGLSITADYYNIKVKNAIDTFGGGLNSALNLCYNVQRNINSPYCQTFVGTRNAQGQIQDAALPVLLNANTGTLRTEGVDVQLSYIQRLGMSLWGNEDSRISFSILGSYLKKFEVTPAADDPDTSTDCRGLFGTRICGNPRPKYKINGRLSWMDGPVTTSFRWRHLGSVRDDDDGTDYTVERIKSYNLFDLAFAFDATDNLNLTAGVQNLFDKKPPIVGSNQEQTNTYPSAYDTLGRDYFISARLKF